LLIADIDSLLWTKHSVSLQEASPIEENEPAEGKHSTYLSDEPSILPQDE